MLGVLLNHCSSLALSVDRRSAAGAVSPIAGRSCSRVFTLGDLNREGPRLPNDWR
jgi:hypothetical protein